jgi:hypothetical protein
VYIGIQPTFRIVGLGLWENLGSSNSSDLTDSRNRYVTLDLGFSYHQLPDNSALDIEKILLADSNPSEQSSPSERFRHLGLLQISKALKALAAQSEPGALLLLYNYISPYLILYYYLDLQPTLRHALTVKDTLLPTSVVLSDKFDEALIRHALENTFLIKFMPQHIRDKFEVSKSFCFTVISVCFLFWLLIRTRCQALDYIKVTHV